MSGAEELMGQRRGADGGKEVELLGQRHGVVGTKTWNGWPKVCYPFDLYLVIC